MSVALPPPPVFQGIGFGGLPLPGGQLFTYIAGTSTPQTTYIDSTQTTPNTNPVILNANVQANVWLNSALAYKFVLQDQFGNQIWSVDQINAPVLTAAVIAAILFPQSPAEISAGITPANFVPPVIIYAIRYGYLANNDPAAAAGNVIALNQAISVASQTVGGATGATVVLPTGIAYINSFIAVPNRVTIIGQNGGGGTIVKATPGFTLGSVPYMFYASNGTTAIFGSILQDIFIDCSSVSGLGGVQSDAWQESDGMIRVTILNFTTIGFHYQHGYGGASTLELSQMQLFSASPASAGIRVETIGSSGAFELNFRDSVIAGNSVYNMPRGIDMVNDSVLVENCHFENVVDAIHLDGQGKSTIITATGASPPGNVTNLIHLVSTFTGTLNVIGCQRNGASLLVLNDVTGESLGSPEVASYVYPDVYCITTAKAVANYNGSTATLAANSYNISSVTKNSTGDYSFHLTRSTQTLNLAPFINCNLAASQIIVSVVNVANIHVQIAVAGTPTDATAIYFTLFGV